MFSSEKKFNALFDISQNSVNQSLFFFNYNY